MRTDRNYYLILGVPSTATQRDIQRAFRSLARQRHPDVSRHPDATRQFQELNEAYQVLGDPAQRARYDRFWHVWSKDIQGEDAVRWQKAEAAAQARKAAEVERRRAADARQAQKDAEVERRRQEETRAPSGASGANSASHTSHASPAAQTEKVGWLIRLQRAISSSLYVTPLVTGLALILIGLAVAGGAWLVSSLSSSGAHQPASIAASVPTPSPNPPTLPPFQPQDMGRLAFALPYSGRQDIFADQVIAYHPDADLRIANPPRLTSLDAGHFATSPSWGSRPDLLYINLDGGIYTLNVSTPTSAPVSLLDYHVDLIDAPSYSAASGQIVFAMHQAAQPGGVRALYTMNPQRPAAVTAITKPSGIDGAPHWSADGRRIVFEHTQDGSTGIELITRLGADPVRLTAGPAEDRSPSFSPDGKQIVFTRAGALWLMDVSGANQHQLADFAPALARDPIFSPDGRWIAFYSNQGSGAWEIDAIHPDGSGLSRLTSLSLNDDAAVPSGYWGIAWR